jgi:hypothetical protein
MATLVFTNALVEVDGVDISDHISEFTLNYSAELLDETAMGDNTRVRKGGLLTWSFDATAHQDFAANELDATLFALVGTSSCWEVRPQNICSSANNPIFSGIGMLETYNPVGGTVGALLDTQITVQSKSTLDRASSSGP